MMFYHISDYDDAYANGPNIVGGDRWAARYAEHAQAFRAALSPHRQRLGLSYAEASPRHVFDLFLPEGEPRGLVVFVHGGYWLRNDGAMWSHLAAGPLARGHAVAVPTYRLAPEARIIEIGVEIAAAVTAAAGLIGGPITLAGHSAGGQLVTRLMASATPLASKTVERVKRVVSISGVHDLRPLLLTSMKAPLRLDEEEARRESPALLEPVAGVNLVAWVGGAERAEFRRQNTLLANIWTELAEPGSGLVAALLD
jgi:arylformamidase